MSSGLLRAFSITAREGSVLNPRFPAPVNTYNPTVHAMVEAVFAALATDRARRRRAPMAAAAARSSSAAARTKAGKSYVQYEILGGGAGARASKDGASGTSVNQSNAKIAPDRDHRERISDARAALRADPRFRRRRANSAAASASAANISISQMRASRSARPST